MKAMTLAKSASSMVLAITKEKIYPQNQTLWHYNAHYKAHYKTHY